MNLLVMMVPFRSRHSTYCYCYCCLCCMVAIHILLFAAIVWRPRLFAILIVAIVQVIVAVFTANGWRRYLMKILLIRWMARVLTIAEIRTLAVDASNSIRYNCCRHRMTILGGSNCFGSDSMGASIACCTILCSPKTENHYYRMPYAQLHTLRFQFQLSLDVKCCRFRFLRIYFDLIFSIPYLENYIFDRLEFF